MLLMLASVRALCECSVIVNEATRSGAAVSIHVARPRQYWQVDR